MAKNQEWQNVKSNKKRNKTKDDQQKAKDQQPSNKKQQGLDASAVGATSAKPQKSRKEAKQMPAGTARSENYATVVKGTPRITGFFAAQATSAPTANRFSPLSQPMETD